MEPEQHWLDRRLPGAREWLEAKNRAWWIKGIEWRCRLLCEQQHFNFTIPVPI